MADIQVEPHVNKIVMPENLKVGMMIDFGNVIEDRCYDQLIHHHYVE